MPLIKYCICLIAIHFFFISIPANAQERIKQSINSNWQFHKGEMTGYPDKSDNKAAWDTLSLPHTWNAHDVNDDTKGYYRGIGWYKKMLYIPASWKKKEIAIYFEGANQTASIYINGVIAGTHTGGYTAFNIPISKLLLFKGENNLSVELEVKVDNAPNEDIAPLSADFTFYGGIYRNVYLTVNNAVHFDTNDLGSGGVFINTPVVSEVSAAVSVKGMIINGSTQSRSVLSITKIYDQANHLVSSHEKKVDISPNHSINFNDIIKNITKPKLWSPDRPYLYRVVSTLTDAQTGEVLDQEENPLGFRWFSFSADNGFMLNGKQLKLIGASRHQDYEGLGNALTDALQIHDIELLKAMGGNFIRIAHYPQAPAILQACDRLGILASEETPVVNQITESKAFSDNCKLMQREMIRQNYNHPSIIIWAYMNEVLLRPRFEKDSERQHTYFKNLATLAGEIEQLTRQEDPSRYTMIPCHGNFSLYQQVGLLSIPTIVGWNLYNGWYSANLSGFAGFIDKFHKDMPDKPFLISEFGADADPRMHSLNPERFDKSQEYAAIYHQTYLKEILARPFVTGGAIWNLADFNSEAREETMPHINNKGIMTTSRQPKNAYFLYQANLLKTPFIKIASRNWNLRSGVAADDLHLFSSQPVEVYTNQPTVKLLLNGKQLAIAKTKNHVCRFDVPFISGINKLEAMTLNCNDAAEINFLLIPNNLQSTALPFQEINVNVGDRRIFVDDQNKQVWLPEQSYHPGSWGYVGGRIYLMKGNARQSFGSDKSIPGTLNDPVYQTQRIGLDGFNFDVPNGEYEITLHFAELESAVHQEAMVYNLGTKATVSPFSPRAFNVIINGSEVIHDLNDETELKPFVADVASFRISVTNNQGIKVHFQGVKGEPILNGIQVKKIL